MPPVKLAALDADDLKVVSAHVQDSLVAGEDMRYLPREKRFVLALKRFAWEKSAAAHKEPDERRVSVLKFDRVLSVRTRGIDRGDASSVYALLSVAFEPRDEPAGTVRLFFAGGAEISLGVECIEAQLADTKAAWRARARPDHGLPPESAGS